MWRVSPDGNSSSTLYHAVDKNKVTSMFRISWCWMVSKILQIGSNILKNRHLNAVVSVNSLVFANENLVVNFIARWH